MTSPSPSPEASPPAPTPPATSLPSVPSYQGAAGANAGVTPSKPGGSSDIWGLGQLYGEPIYLGYDDGARDTGMGFAISGTAADSGMGFLLPGTSVPSSPTSGWGNTQDLMKKIQAMWAAQSEEKKKHPDQLTSFERLQQQLWEAGAYGQTSYQDIHVGQWTNQTVGAIKSALGSYEQVVGQGNPMTFDDFVKAQAVGNSDGGFASKASNQPGYGSTTKVPKPPTFRVSLTDPAAIQAAAQSAFESALGRQATPEELQTFVTEFQSQQRQAELTSETAQPGQVTQYSQPNLSTDALQYAQGTNPGEAKQHNAESYTNAILNMFLPSGSARPNETPVPTIGG